VLKLSPSTAPKANPPPPSTFSGLPLLFNGQARVSDACRPGGSSKLALTTAYCLGFLPHTIHTSIVEAKPLVFSSRPSQPIATPPCTNGNEAMTLCSTLDEPPTTPPEKATVPAGQMRAVPSAPPLGSGNRALLMTV
jgi:hypothetical protein